MIHYRTFRNTDPPGLVEVWNTAFTGRGAARLQGCSWTEFFLFSKSYFDPENLIIAQADGQIVGFAWAGFGPNESENALDAGSGVVCLIGVAPSHRRQGIGSELLRRAEAHLRSRGSNELFAGPMYPLNPYTFGLYGGSNSPGFLDSDPLARPFFEHHGYSIEHSCLVFQCPLMRALNIVDGRFAAHRLRYEINISPFQGTTWWQECILGPVELYEYRLKDKLTNRRAARALMWEMETYVPSWNAHAIGITDIVVSTEMRRHGLAKFLMAQMLRYLQDQFFNVVEMQVPADNTDAINLLRTLGFEQVDVGHVYRKEGIGDRG
ncbi:MAG TPA: GNAT family N-acetyltransferase [Gemmataceae bacterium]|nr:GNAT family N-acetyltransferase [Gemmataceae bacterium]